MNYPRRFKKALGLSVLVSGIAAAILSPHAVAQTTTNYPSKPVKLVVGFGPGTGPDYVGRLLAQKLSELWGDRATVFVENKSGAGGNLAPADVSRASPDGHTLVLSTISSFVIAPAISSKLPYNAQKDFVHITQVGVSAFAFLTNPKTVPATNVREFVSWARKQPKGIFMGTFGAGTTGHFATIIFTSAVDIKTDVIHYRTTPDVISALVNGDIAGVMSSLTVAAPHVRS
jgi:tripartite-type tricarboxylate transporter receptor subunit TctC